MRHVAGVLGAALLVTGGSQIAQWMSARHFEAAGAVPSGAAEPPAPGTPAILLDSSFTPSRLRLPALGVTATVVPVGLGRDGSLVIPEDPRVLGWWSGGGAPGSPVGTVVIAGHVDSAVAGAGALFRLDGTPLGARITVSGPGGEATYVVRARRRYAKQGLPSASLFAQDEAPRLVLVTCGGEFDPAARHYSDNVVVVATPG